MAGLGRNFAFLVPAFFKKGDIMKYYVVSDTHGFCTKLKETLRIAGFFDETEPHKLVLCGDLLDRGPEACELVDFMIELMEQDKLIYVLGNHEELMVKCLQEISRGGVYDIACGMSVHQRNGTWDSILQIAKMGENEAVSNPLELVRRVLHSPLYERLMRVGIDYYETPNYIFTHGWIPCYADIGYGYSRYDYNPNWREADPVSWGRARWINGMEAACVHNVKEPCKTVVCGHWHTSWGHSVIDGKGSEWGEDADFSPFYADGVIAIDACTAGTGRVNCIIIED